MLPTLSPQPNRVCPGASHETEELLQLASFALLLSLSGCYPKPASLNELVSARMRTVPIILASNKDSLDVRINNYIKYLDTLRFKNAEISLERILGTSDIRPTPVPSPRFVIRSPAGSTRQIACRLTPGEAGRVILQAAGEERSLAPESGSLVEVVGRNIPSDDQGEFRS